MNENADIATVELATELTMAWLANPNTRADADRVCDVLRLVHGSVSSLSQPILAEVALAEVVHTPAVSARKSLADPERIISMIDGRPYASLKRHLAKHGLTPDAYRERYNLKSDYPMVAPTYSARRSEHARKVGLGRKVGKTIARAGEALEQVAEATLTKVEGIGVTVLPSARKKLGIKA